MLRRFYVDNYKSLINVTFEPCETSLFLGINNAGKTNLCQAMRFLSWTASHNLDDCADAIAGSRYGLTNRYFEKDTVDFRVGAETDFENERLQFSYDLTITAPPRLDAAPTIQIVRESLKVTGKGFDDICLLENIDGRVRLLHESDHLRGTSHCVDTKSPRDTTMLNRLYDLSTNPRANLFKQYLGAWQYYSLSPEALREPLHRPNETLLRVDGGNLSSVLYFLKNTNEREYRKLIKHVQKLDPSIDLMNFHLASEDSVFMFFEDTEGRMLPARNASSGTLRYIAMLYVLTIQASFAKDVLILFEEPENGIYVGFLRDLLQLVESAKSKPQVVFTSHSPYFIDLFDDRIESIFLLKRGDKHSMLSKPDVEKVRSRLERFPLGEQHFREMLG